MHQAHVLPGNPVDTYKTCKIKYCVRKKRKWLIKLEVTYRDKESQDKASQLKYMCIHTVIVNEPKCLQCQQFTYYAIHVHVHVS